MSKSKLKPFVTFQAKFGPHPANEIAGRNLADLLAQRLSEKGFEVKEAENAEYAFFVNCLSENTEYAIMVGRSSIDNKSWEISCPPPKSHWFKQLLRKPQTQGLSTLLDAIDDIIKDEPSVSNINWFENYDDLETYLEPGKSTFYKKLLKTSNRFQRLLYYFFPLLIIFFFLMVVNSRIFEKVFFASIAIAIGGWCGLGGLLIVTRAWLDFRKEIKRHSIMAIFSFFFQLAFVLLFLSIAFMMIRLLFRIISEVFS